MVINRDRWGLDAFKVVLIGSGLAVVIAGQALAGNSATFILQDRQSLEIHGPYQMAREIDLKDLDITLSMRGKDRFVLDGYVKGIKQQLGPFPATSGTTIKANRGRTI